MTYGGFQWESGRDPMRDVTIACICMHSEVGEVERNLTRINRFIDRAVSEGAEIVCFPELSVSGYLLRAPDTIYDESYSQEIISRVQEMAKQKGVVLLAGLVEIKQPGKPYIAQVVAGPKGPLGIYRKTHLSPMEQGVFQPGHEIPVFEYEGVVFGVQLCWEAHFPEISTIMALKGAEVLFMPHASPRTGPQEKLESWLRHMKSRAFDNAVYVAACNQVGKTREGYVFPGVAVIIDPAGRVIAQRGQKRESIVLATLEAAKTEEIKKSNIKYFLPNRRPELYRALLKKKPY